MHSCTMGFRSTAGNLRTGSGIRNLLIGHNWICSRIEYYRLITPVKLSNVISGSLEYTANHAGETRRIVDRLAVGLGLENDGHSHGHSLFPK